MDLIETKKNLMTYLRFLNKNVDQESILTYIYSMSAYTKSYLVLILVVYFQ